MAQEKSAALTQALDRLLEAYMRYYNIERQTPAAPFDAEAVFRSHEEQYFLFRMAKMTDFDSNEYIFFALEEDLSKERLLELDAAAWEEGISRAVPSTKHRSTDVGLCVLTNHAQPEALSLVPKLKHSKSYRFGLHGYSQYRLVVYDLTGKTCVRNRMGDTLEKTIAHIFK